MRYADPSYSPQVGHISPQVGEVGHKHISCPQVGQQTYFVCSYVLLTYYLKLLFQRFLCEHYYYIN